MSVKVFLAGHGVLADDMPATPIRDVGWLEFLESQDPGDRWLDSEDGYAGIRMGGVFYRFDCSYGANPMVYLLVAMRRDGDEHGHFNEAIPIKKLFNAIDESTKAWMLLRARLAAKGFSVPQGEQLGVWDTQ